MGTSFMPSMDSTEMSATLEMPIGSSKKDTIKMSDKIINNLMKIMFLRVKKQFCYEIFS